MNIKLRADAEKSIKESIKAVQPDAAVKRALGSWNLSGRIVLVAIGKAGLQKQEECLCH